MLKKLFCTLAVLAAAIVLVAPARSQTESAPFPGTKSQWHGYDRYTFIVDGRRVGVVVPKEIKPGRPWLLNNWFGDPWEQTAEPLLARGLFYVSMDVNDMLGCPRAVAHWNALYDELTLKYGFSRKVALQGISRGGLIVYNWASANPEKVACIYGDAPVCDFKSWPGGGKRTDPPGTGSWRPDYWKKILDEYGLTEEQALAYQHNPVDSLEPLARAHVPLLHVHGDADNVVPLAENTAIVAGRYRKLGGDITVIIKKGVGHKHGLEDPTPIIDFILKNAVAAAVVMDHRTLESLPALPVDFNQPPKTDWLVTPMERHAGVFRSSDGKEIVMNNGLISRSWRVAPNAATVAFDNLMTGDSILRGVKPEAMVELDGIKFDVGGLLGQRDYGYLRTEWLDALTGNPEAFQYTGFEVGPTRERMQWKRKRYSADMPWPPPGVALTLNYKLSNLSAGMIESMGTNTLAKSDQDRELLLSDDFKTVADSWTVFHTAHDRASFVDEGKPGEIRAPANTYVYAERKLPAGTRLVECRVNAGTDRSSGFGPGLAVVWPQRVVKFYLRPDRKTFGVWDGKALHKTGRIGLARDYYLRLRIEDQSIECEAALDDMKWFSVHHIPVDSPLGDPTLVRLGKTSETGGDGDGPQPGEYGLCKMGAFRAYGPLNAAALASRASLLNKLSQLTVSVHYEMYDGIPLLSKWLTISNAGAQPVMLNTFTSEILAAVEYESVVDQRDHWDLPNIHIQSDYTFRGMDPQTANQTVHWVIDPQYNTQVNASSRMPAMMESRPPIGPAIRIEPGGTFESYHTFELVHDSTDRERKGLAVRQMYRRMAPWITENPIMMHVRNAEPKAVRLAIDQCAEVGFEMVIISFWSGFDMENEDPAYLATYKELADYAHSKGVELGGYSLLASRSAGPKNDIVDPATGKTGGVFGVSPCIGSVWGQDYFRKLYAFFEKTGFDLLEHDGSYPGDMCGSTSHPGHHGLEDSQWTQWKTITDFYHWCRGRGIYLNVPDLYYMEGSSKCGMGYREANWSLPRAQQLIHARQNIYDGTWEKTPSMGWMMVPLVEYGGGGPAATIEPLAQHLDHYNLTLADNFGAGVQACYRGPRLFDTDETKQLVKKWADFYKKHRAILDSDLIHVRRADARDIDCMMHVNPRLPEKGLAMVYNPLDIPVKKILKLPLYYTGLTDKAVIGEQDGPCQEYRLDRKFYADLPVNMEPRSVTWFVIQ